jgi:hypothetical protein
MPLSSVDLYEQLKPHLGENETKALIEYMDEKVKGEVATKQDLALLKQDLVLLESRLKDEIWKLRLLIVIVLVVVIVLNPSVVEFVSKIFGVAK